MMMNRLQQLNGGWDGPAGQMRTQGIREHCTEFWSTSEETDLKDKCLWHYNELNSCTTVLFMIILKGSRTI